MSKKVVATIAQDGEEVSSCLAFPLHTKPTPNSSRMYLLAHVRASHDDGSAHALGSLAKRRHLLLDLLCQLASRGKNKPDGA
eukprot:9493155-Pyramimonas_sp.AAC.1